LHSMYESGPLGTPIGRRNLIREGLALMGGVGALSLPLTAAATTMARPNENSRAPVNRRRILDFRARPNTETFMRLFPRTPKMPLTTNLAGFIAELDQVGVTKAVFTGRLTAPYAISNDYIANCARAFPDRIIPIGGVNVFAKAKAVAEAERALGELKFRGLSIDLQGIYADDRLLYPIYYKCIEHDVPILLTCGPYMTPFNDPARIAVAASDLPELKIVCTHAVTPGTDVLIAIAFLRSNVYLEPSVYHYMTGFAEIMRAAGSYLQDKVIYGSGFPFSLLTDFQFYEKFGIDPGILDKILYMNGARLLKLV